MEDVKKTVHRLTDRLQAILGYLELSQYHKALSVTKETITELRLLAKQLTGMCMTLPSVGSVVVVPHGTRVVSHEDVNVDVAPNEVRVVLDSDVRKGHGTANKKTK